MNGRIGLILVLAALQAGSVAAEGAADAGKGASQPPIIGKPQAPVQIRWLEGDKDGRLAVSVLPTVAYERLEVVLIVPGATATRVRRVFPAGDAGRPVDLDWTSPGDTVIPRLLVIIDAGGRRMGRASSPPSAGRDKAHLQRNGRLGRVDRDAGLRILPARGGPVR